MNFRLVMLVTLCIPLGMALRLTQPYRLVASDGELRLHCSYKLRTQPEELLVALYRGMHGAHRVCTTGLNLTHSEPGFQTEGPIRCRAEHGFAGVDLVVSGLKGEDTDLYRCALEILYPPPYRVGTGNGTLFHIPEKPACPEPAPQKQDSSESTGQLLSVLVPAAIITSVVFVTVIVTLIIKALLKQNRRGYPGLAAVTARRVDCRFGYENFL